MFMFFEMTENWWVLCPPHHVCCIQRVHLQKDKVCRKGGWIIKCDFVGFRGWLLSSPPLQGGGRNLQRSCVPASVWSSGHCLWILGYFNHETSDKQWIMWLHILMCTFNQRRLISKIQFHNFNFNFLPPTPWQNCVILSLPLCPPHQFWNHQKKKRKGKNTSA